MHSCISLCMRLYINHKLILLYADHKPVSYQFLPNTLKRETYLSCQRPLARHHKCKRGMLHTLISIPLIYYILTYCTSIYIILPQYTDTSSSSIVLPHGILGSPQHNISDPHEEELLASLLLESKHWKPRKYPYINQSRLKIR